MFYPIFSFFSWNDCNILLYLPSNAAHVSHTKNENKKSEYRYTVKGLLKYVLLEKYCFTNNTILQENIYIYKSFFKISHLFQCVLQSLCN